MVVGQVHAVDQQPVVGGQSGEAIDGAGVVRTLGDVDVHPDAVAGGEFGGRGERVVGAGECGVHADHAPPTLAQESIVLLQAPTCAVGAVTVGDPVARDHAHADLGAGVGDHTQRSLDRVRRLVVVDDRRAAGFERFERAELGRPLEHLEIERCVEPPPDLLEHAQEGRGHIRRRRHAPRQAPSRGGGGRTPALA